MTNWDTAQQLLRIILQIVAGALVSNGYLNEEMSMTLTGGVISIASVVWWIYWNGRAKPKSR